VHESLAARDTRRSPADHDPELTLVVEPPVGKRQLDRTIRADYRRGRLDEACVRVDVAHCRAFVDTGRAAHLILVQSVVDRRGEDLRRSRLRSTHDHP
jgi:hypothetical protein